MSANVKAALSPSARYSSFTYLWPSDYLIFLGFFVRSIRPRLLKPRALD